MPKFSIAFATTSDAKPLIHQLIEADDKETALKEFFTAGAAEFYSANDQGYHYFKEDFSDRKTPAGSIIEC